MHLVCRGPGSGTWRSENLYTRVSELDLVSSQRVSQGGLVECASVPEVWPALRSCPGYCLRGVDLVHAPTIRSRRAGRVPRRAAKVATTVAARRNRIGRLQTRQLGARDSRKTLWLQVLAKTPAPAPVSSDPPDAGTLVDEPPVGWVRAIVAVGSGAGRIRSLDQGLTWRDSSRFANGGGDDVNLLRSVAYGRGRWIAVGWKLLVSTDAVQWSERKSPCGLSTGVAYGNGWFVMTCNGRPFRSRDAVTWTQGGTADVGGHPLVLFDGKRFVSWGDNSRAFESVDADTWKLLAGVDDISYCDGMVKPT